MKIISNETKNKKLHEKREYLSKSQKYTDTAVCNPTTNEQEKCGENHPYLRFETSGVESTNEFPMCQSKSLADNTNGSKILRRELAFGEPRTKGPYYESKLSLNY